MKQKVFSNELLQKGNDDGLSIRVLSRYHKILTQLYGDCMQLPPEGDRAPRHITEIICENEIRRD